MKRRKRTVKPIPSIIPQKIFHDESISDGAKVFYGVVVFLARETGVAFAGTRYLANQLSRSTRSIQYYISELHEKRIIDIEFKDGKRLIYPSIMYQDAEDIAAFIPPEQVKSNLSAAVKLTYGLLQYKTANINGYYGVNGIDELAKLTNKSRSTIYRHIKVWKQMKLVKWSKNGDYRQFYTFNTYQDAYKLKYKTVDSYLNTVNDPPDVNTRPVTSYAAKNADKLRSLIGR